MKGKYIDYISENGMTLKESIDLCAFYLDHYLDSSDFEEILKNFIGNDSYVFTGDAKYITQKCPNGSKNFYAEINGKNQFIKCIPNEGCIYAYFGSFIFRVI